MHEKPNPNLYTLLFVRFEFGLVLHGAVHCTKQETHRLVGSATTIYVRCLNDVVRNLTIVAQSSDIYIDQKYI